MLSCFCFLCCHQYLNDVLEASVLWVLINDDQLHFLKYALLNLIGIYQGGVWKVRVELPNAYSYKSQKVSIGFINKIYHPNVHEMCVPLNSISCYFVYSNHDDNWVSNHFWMDANFRSCSVCLDVIDQTWSPMFGNNWSFIFITCVEIPLVNSPVALSLQLKLQVLCTISDILHWVLWHISDLFRIAISDVSIFFFLSFAITSKSYCASQDVSLAWNIGRAVVQKAKLESL